MIEPTLREGEQSVGASFGTDQKTEIARLLDGFGVECIELTSPCVSPQSLADAITIAKLGLRSRIITHIRCHRGSCNRFRARAESWPTIAAGVSSPERATLKVGSQNGNRRTGPFRLCVIEGDGIGREVIPAAVTILSATGFPFEATYARAGWECFAETGVALPEETLEAIHSCDAVLFGAITSPLYKVEGYSSPILELRKQLDLFANLRPCRSWPIPTSRPDVDLVIVRENNEGLYVRRERSDGQTAVAERRITRQGSARIARVACDLAMGRLGRDGQRRLTIVHKANVLPQTCGLFRQVALDVAAGYPELVVEDLLVDTMALRLITDPERFDVIVTSNLFGDILSDEAAGLVGGLGLAPSANVGTNGRALFEPVHGSAPDIAGRGIANPIAAVLAVAMLLDHIGQCRRALALRQAVEQVLALGPHTPDLGGSATTEQVTAAIQSRIFGWAADGGSRR
jgi:homoisocitrate dehydrogenase